MSRSLPTRRVRRLIPAALLAVLVGAPALGQTIQTPEQYLGFRVGTDNRLAHWDQILGYMQRVDEVSDRVRVEILGKTTLGRDFPLVIVTSAENMADLERIRQDNRRLYVEAADLSPSEAARIVAGGKAVVCITLNIHSTEIGASQMVLEAVHRLATERSDYIQHILDEVVLLVVPSLNPDGQAMVVEWHDRTFGTEYEGARMPWLYHYYTGHDNNRDAYMMSQAETRHLARVLYHEWFPEVWLDEHQMGNRGARLFLMPAAGPPNPNVDPWIYRMAGLLGFAQAAALDEAGKTGVIYGQTYTYWWQGAMAWTGWWHNMIGMLSEAASANLAAPVTSVEVPADWRPGEGSYEPPGGRPEGVGPPPRDLTARPDYLNPWRGGTWSLRDIVDYELLLTFGLLDAAADMRENLLSGMLAVNRRTIEKGRAGHPFAIVVPADQHDDPTVLKFLDVLRLGGVRIDQAAAGFNADGVTYPAGTWVIPMDQVFRNYAKDLIEPQRYPSDVRPYDVTGWSLGMQMGVQTVFVDRPFPYQAAADPALPASAVVGDGDYFLLDARYNDSHTAALRLLRAGLTVSRTSGENMVADRVFPAGTFVVQGRRARAAVEEAIADLHMTSWAVPVAPAGRRLRRAPRVGLYQAWGGNMDEGWTRYVLDTFGWEPIVVHPEDLRDARRLDRTYDVILFPDGNSRSVLQGLGGNTLPEYQGGIGESGLAALHDFVRSGGTLVALGGGIDLLMQHFDVPFTDGRAEVPRGEFNCPGSILEVQVDASRPLAWGMPQTAHVMFANDPTLEPDGVLPGTPGEVVVRFGDADPLRSGYIQGPQHLFGDVGAATVAVGEGTLVLLPLRVQRRAQTHGTFKLLFNALMNSVIR